MKNKAERTPRDRNEKRRQLLRKKYLKPEFAERLSLADNNRFTNENTTASALALKLKGLNRRVLAVVLAFAMAVSLLTGVGIHFVTKAATKDAAHTLTALPYTVTAADASSNRFKSGDTYFYEYEGRTYTYEFDETLIEGDQLLFDTESKSISWYRDATFGIDKIEDASNNVTKDNESEDPTPSFTYSQDKNGDGSVIPKDKAFSYKMDDGSNYIFSFDEDVSVIGRNKVRNNNGILTDYHAGSFVLDFNENSPTATIDDKNYQLHSLYVEENTFDNGAVYLLEGNGKLIGYTGQTDGTINESGSNNTPRTLTKFGLALDSAHSTVWAGSEYVPYQNNFNLNGKRYYDGGYVLTPDSGFNYSAYLLNELQVVLDSNHGNVNYYFLEAINPSNYAYSTDRILGHYYSDNGTREVCYHLRSTNNHGGFLGIARTSNYEYSIWQYANRRLYTYRTSSSGSSYFTVGDNDLSLSNSATTLTTYKKYDAYIPEATNRTVSLTILDTPADESGSFPVKSVSYTDNATIAGNDLEIDKTVTEVDRDEGIFDIKLEAYTTAPTLNQPATDIELVLDTSRNMNNILYSRQYKNLNTYEGFKEIDLTSGRITHDELFDRDAGDWGGAVLEIISRIFAGDRNYIHNKYVEDPAAPGTYVYLHQQYELRNLVQNRYKYYFTSSDGTTYETQTFTQNIIGTGLDPAPIASSGLTFTASGKDPVVRKAIYTLANYSGRNTDNGSAATNKELFEVSEATGLYIKDNDGNFRRVYLYKNVRGNGTPQGVAQTGMYRYVIFKNDVEFGEIEYEFTTGNTQLLNDPDKGRGGAFGVFQGFRNYNDDHELQGDYILSKTLYTKTDEDVTALQAMKEALESFLLNAHAQVAEKGAEAYIGLVAYDRDAQVKYKLNSNGTTGSYTDLAKTVGDNSVDLMISDIYNYRVTQQYDRVSRQTGYYNVINDSNHNGRRYNGTYASEVDDGLALAKDELQYHNHDKRNTVTGDTIKSRRYAVLFTAGVPSAYTSFLGFDTSGDFTTATASRAISNANDIKNQLDTTVYSVGLFDNADEAKINGDYWYYATFGQKVPCSGRVGSYWGGSWVANGFNIDPKDAYATNRMLAYISSDYSTPRTLGLTRDSYHPGRSGIWGWLSSGTGYRIDQNFSRNDTGYYLAVSPNTLIETDSTDDGDEYAHATEDVAAILADVFQKLNIATAAPRNTLNEQSYLVDGITNYFDLVIDDPSHMPTAQVMDMNNVVDQAKTNALHVDYDEGGNLATTTKTIAVNGFPYSTYWVGDNTNDQRKVVLTFRVKRTNGLIGGNDIPTNLSKTAIYDGDPAAKTDITPWGIMEERYEIPKVDLPIEMSKFSQDNSIYYGNTQDLQKTLDLSDLAEIGLAGNNGTLIPNEFVNIAYEIKDGNRTVNTYRVPVGSTIGKWDHPIQEDAQNNGTPGAVHTENLERIYVQPTESTTYTVNVSVSPVYNGTVRTTDFNDNDANVYVFTPHYETYNGMVDSAGDTYDLTETGKTPLLAEWNYDEVLTLEEGFDPATLLDPKEMPSVEFELAKYDDEIKTIPPEGKIRDTFETTGSTTSQTAESTQNNLDAYVVNQRTDLLMDNVKISATPHEYTIEQKVAENYYDSIGVIYKTIYFDENLQPTSTVYYDANGEVMPDATGPRAPGTYIDENDQEVAITFNTTPEPEYGSITKQYVPDSLNASTNDKVTFLNTDDGRTNGAFTISLKEHEVIIKNHTTGEDGEDYSDPAHKFPLTLTLTNGNEGFNGTVKYTVGTGTQEETLTFENGVATQPIQLADEEYVTLKNVKDGYALTITSSPQPTDLYSFHAGAGPDADHLTALTVDDATETTEPVTITTNKYIDLTHHIGRIPVTGFYDSGSKVNPFFVAAAIVAILGGAGTGYAIKRKKETEA